MGERTRSYVMDDLGDPNAEPGSKPWSVFVANEIHTALHDVEFNGVKLRDYIKLFQKYEGYRQWRYPSWGEYCVKRLHKRPEEIDGIVADRVQAHAMRALPAQIKGRHASSCYNCNMRQGGGGNDPASLSSRIARDRPDILEDMKAGKYRSVRAAAIDAGIIDPEKSRRYQMPTAPEAAGRYMRERVGEDWLEKFIAAFKS